MTADKTHRMTFDEVADLYDEVRPGYPDQLVEDVISLSGIPKGGHILEVGCGPGTATLPFARRGYKMLCLELGANLAALAERNLSVYSNVTVTNIAFEDWPVDRSSFDLVLSAEAWHWIPPEIGYARAAETLREGGALALIWIQQPVPDTPFYRALVALYEEIAPPPLLIGHPDPDGLIVKTVADINASGLFGEVAVHSYWWTAYYSAEQYVKLLNTYSMYRVLDAEVRQNLLDAVHHLIQAFGGTVERPYRGVLYLTHRATKA